MELASTQPPPPPKSATRTRGGTLPVQGIASRSPVRVRAVSLQRVACSLQVAYKDPLICRVLVAYNNANVSLQIAYNDSALM